MFLMLFNGSVEKIFFSQCWMNPSSSVPLIYSCKAPKVDRQLPKTAKYIDPREFHCAGSNSIVETFLTRARARSP